MKIARWMAFLFVSFALSACSSPSPRSDVSADDWIEYNSNVRYSVTHKSEDQIYLTIRYVTYTFLDKSAEMIPAAKTNFMAIAQDLAGDYREAKVDQASFYQSLGYNGITGISSVIVSNNVRFRSRHQSGEEQPINADAELRIRLIEAERLRSEELITEQEYEALRRRALGLQ